MVGVLGGLPPRAAARLASSLPLRDECQARSPHACSPAPSTVCNGCAAGLAASMPRARWPVPSACSHPDHPGARGVPLRRAALAARRRRAAGGRQLHSDGVPGPAGAVRPGCAPRPPVSSAAGRVQNRSAWEACCPGGAGPEVHCWRGDEPQQPGRPRPRCAAPTSRASHAGGQSS